MSSEAEHTTSFRAFIVVWVGQLVSVTGTRVMGFGLQLFVFIETGSVTQLAFVSLAYVIPSLALAPLAGSVIDRTDRRKLMLLSDAAAGVATLVLVGVYAAGSLEMWHIYVVTAVGAGANTFQDPAWMASVSVLVPKERLSRANGLVQLNQGIAIVLAPAIAGALLALSGLGAVLILDVATFAIGVITLALVRFPEFEKHETEHRSVGADWRYSWRYLIERSGLLGLLLIYAVVNFMLSATNVLIIPLIMSFSTEAAAGIVLSITGIGGIIGSLAVSVFGTPKRLVLSIMGGIAVSGLFVSFQGFRESLALITVMSVLLMLVNPIVNSASQVIWQTKVDEGSQGRVFSLRRMLASAISPIAIFIAGPLSDNVFEPALAEGGALADTVGAIIGVGPGRGIAFIYVLAGLGMSVAAIAGWLNPHVRTMESELPDLAGR